jgi:hypothetical protein
MKTNEQKTQTDNLNSLYFETLQNLSTDDSLVCGKRGDSNASNGTGTRETGTRATGTRATGTRATGTRATGTK